MIVTMLIYIYPLRAIFGAMWYLLSDGRVGDPLGSHATETQERTVFAIFALGFIAVALEIMLLNVRSWQLREPLRLNTRERLMTRREITGWSIPIGGGVASVILSLTPPIAKLPWAGWMYFSMIVLLPLHSVHRSRLKQRPRL